MRKRHSKEEWRVLVKEEWRVLVAEWKQSGDTAKVFARRNGVHSNTLKWWSYKLGREKPTRREKASEWLVRVETSASPASVVDVRIGEVYLRFEGADPGYLGAVVEAVVERC
jgi:transposase-like protein